MNHNPYEIDRSDAEIARVRWYEPLENARPADDVEHLFLQLSQNSDSQPPATTVELDLSNCPSINTRGIAFLIYLRRRLTDHGISWSISHAPPTLGRTLALLDLESEFCLPGTVRPPEGEQNAAANVPGPHEDVPGSREDVVDHDAAASPTDNQLDLQRTDS